MQNQSSDAQPNDLTTAKDYRQRRALLRSQAAALLGGQLPPREPEQGHGVSFAQHHQLRFAQSLARGQIIATAQRQQTRTEAYRLLEADQALQGFEVLQPGLQAMESHQAETEALAYARGLLQRLGGVYTPQQQEAANKIIWLALEVARREPQRLGGWRQSYLTLHLRGYELAAALFPNLGQDAAEKALERTLNALTRWGILERKSHIGNARDRKSGRRLGWSDGTLIKVRLNPDPRCHLPKLTVEELRESYCDLEAETHKHWTLRRSAKSTALRKQVEQHQSEMSETRAPHKEKTILKAILLTAVKTITFSARFFDSDNLASWLARGVEQYKTASRAVQAAWVADGTRRIAIVLDDGHSLRQWALILWRGLSSQRGGFAALIYALKEVLAVGQRYQIRNKGAWVMSWLQKNGGVELIVGLAT